MGCAAFLNFLFRYLKLHRSCSTEPMFLAGFYQGVMVSLGNDWLLGWFTLYYK